ncbi:hypothetical protein P154DRAFT_534627 [Amniculicola lignicola CBS 123094]|uniref:Uncharacterized protein n=1 Tax=Amniculicola lignicola CBS 123094 TaxID=1392246 RepID=A0A6A5WFA1_9PLEO|nr:hypothetical protein P154DRAFT_534627 [Amniculicola lignicola CBS 123094]
MVKHIVTPPKPDVSLAQDLSRRLEAGSTNVSQLRNGLQKKIIQQEVPQTRRERNFVAFPRAEEPAGQPTLHAPHMSEAVGSMHTQIHVDIERSGRLASMEVPRMGPRGNFSWGGTTTDDRQGTRRAVRHPRSDSPSRGTLVSNASRAEVFVGVASIRRAEQARLVGCFVGVSSPEKNRRRILSLFADQRGRADTQSTRAGRETLISVSSWIRIMTSARDSVELAAHRGTGVANGRLMQSCAGAANGGAGFPYLSPIRFRDGLTQDPTSAARQGLATQMRNRVGQQEPWSFAVLDVLAVAIGDAADRTSLPADTRRGPRAPTGAQFHFTGAR